MPRCERINPFNDVRCDLDEGHEGNHLHAVITPMVQAQMRWSDDLDTIMREKGLS